MVTVEDVLAVIDKTNCFYILLLSLFPSNKFSLPTFFFHGFEK